MAFVIVSTGALAGSRIHTVRFATLLVAVGAIAFAVLAGGLALGFRIGQTSVAATGGDSDSPAMALDPARPESQALIERVGALSGRLIRLESEAIRLAKRLGVPYIEASPDTVATGTLAEPSGGPLVAPLGGSVTAIDRMGISADFSANLARLGVDLDRIEEAFASVAEASTSRDLDSMAFPSRAPIKGGRISSGFGNRRDPFTQRLARHTGIDMPAPYGAPILASAGGRVRFAGHRGAYGRTVEIDHGNGLVTRYGHASKLHVRTGEVVLPGQKIAAVGSSGRSTGPHLHFEVLSKGAQVEPRRYLARSGS